MVLIPNPKNSVTVLADPFSVIAPPVFAVAHDAAGMAVQRLLCVLLLVVCWLCVSLSLSRSRGCSCVGGGARSCEQR
jgi:hypothetical protein